jgi:signal transduction histidine kinase
LDDLRKLNEKKNELLGFAAHDLRSPLAVIMGYAGFLKDKVESDAETLKDVDKILTAVRRMNLIVNQVVDISAIEAGKVKLELDRVDINYLLNEVFLFYQNAARQKSIALTFTRSSGPLMVNVDPNRMGEVVDNLVSNALKYTFPNGRVEMRAVCIDGRIVFEVEDTGQGMTEKDLQLVFRSFTRLSARPTAGESSSGLGLAIVKKIVDLHGGRVAVKSLHGKGTVFSVSLPAG